MKPTACSNAVSAVLFCVSIGVCKPPFSVKVLISMIEAQEEFFKSEIIKPFEKKQKVKIDVRHFGDVDSIPDELARHPRSVCVVKVPFDKAGSLVNKGLMKPLDDFLTPDEMRDFDKVYLLTTLGRMQGKQYYMPRKFETRIMVYVKSRVQEAIAVWRNFREDINAELKKYNGYGLPATYLLEDDPNRWDFFDVFVAGWVWAHTSYNGKVAGRIGHRSKRYSGTALRVIDRAFSCGADSASIVTMRGDAVADAFCWEALYAASGCYSPRMWTEAWSGAGVWDGFRSGDVFLSFMTQLDCFFIHGTGRDGLGGFLENPEEMGVAIMPAGCSVALDAAGNPVREGTHAISTGGWWWGIPFDTPDPRLSYQIIRAITNTENQVQECNRFGMIPVRKDILGDMSMLFGGGWITQVYDVSFKQLMANKKTTLPAHPRFDEIRNVYLDAWFDIVVDRNWSLDRKTPDPRYIRQVLDEHYAVQVAKLK